MANDKHITLESFNQQKRVAFVFPKYDFFIPLGIQKPYHKNIPLHPKSADSIQKWETKRESLVKIKTERRAESWASQEIMGTADLSERGTRRLEMKTDQWMPRSRRLKKPTYLNSSGSSTRENYSLTDIGPTFEGNNSFFFLLIKGEWQTNSTDNSFFFLSISFFFLLAF